MLMMEEIQSADTKKFTIYELLASDNLAEQIPEKDLEDIGIKVIREFDLDKNSRLDWEERTEESMKLALQVVEAKSFPWPNAANVKFPLLTIAALQYHARAYPALLPSTNVVKCKMNAKDVDGSLAQQAKRIEDHMSFQMLEEDENWEDQMDRVLITQPIIGCAFKKTYYNAIKGYNCSENILAKDLVVPYFAKSLETATRISHILYMTENDIYERTVRGIYIKQDLSKAFVTTPDGLQQAQDKAQGLTEATQDPDKPYELIEQHRFLDLDGDGYAEPYIVVVDRHSKKVLRVVARFFLDSVEFGKDNKILSIKAENYFTKFPFIPSPDGGFYDLGFGVLLGPLNKSINTLINQLIDAGTMSVTGGGFLSRGIKIKSGNFSFAPNEWKPVESTGDDLRKGIMPLPVREPNQVLFTLLSLLINYGERIGGSVDILVGENPGQNTPAETSRTMAEQGMKIFSGIFKRTHRGMRDEFRKWFRLNQLYLDKAKQYGDKTISPQDYQGDVGTITPASDPNMVSDSQRVMQAQSMMAAMASQPGLYNAYKVNKRYLESMRVQEIEEVLPDPKGPNKLPPFTPPKVQEAQVKVQGKMQEVQSKEKISQGQLQLKMADLMQQSQINQATVQKLEAETLYLLEQADGVKDGHAIAMIEMQLAAAKHKQDGIQQSMDFMKMVHDQYMDTQQMELDKKTAAQPQAGA